VNSSTDGPEDFSKSAVGNYSMSDRYGVDPSTPASRRDLADLLRLFDPSEGRFVVGFPQDWTERFRAHVGNGLDLDRKRGDEALGLMKRTLLPSTLRYDERRAWADNASILRAQDRVRLLIGPAGSPATVAALPELMEQPRPLPTARERLITRDVKSYLEMMEPLFRTSLKVVMIDRWFALRGADRRPDPRRNVLAHLLCEAERCGVRAFHLAVDPTKAFREFDPEGRQYAKDLDELRMPLRRMELKLEKRTDGSHARYLLGNHVGLQFDHGFDVDDHLTSRKSRKLNHIHWLTDEVLGRLHRDYGW
jgi:hypothetical protein